MSRIDKLVSEFDGLIKYTPMIQDHPKWTDEQCIAFAKEQHEKALTQYAKDPGSWNYGVAYARNVWREDKA